MTHTIAAVMKVEFARCTELSNPESGAAYGMSSVNIAADVETK